MFEILKRELAKAKLPWVAERRPPPHRADSSIDVMFR
jgi:hypothetical protein